MADSLVRYRNIVMDSVRWEGFEFRDGDIVISTPAKCGTTWTQMICALLVFGSTEFPQALDLVSPWLDQTLRSLDDVVRDLEAQQHRRFIKSHTPFDGLPFDDRVTYICVGRDPRDVALSWDNHFLNLDFGQFLALREKAVGNGDLAELMPDLTPPPESEAERFWQWVDSPIDAPSFGLATTLHHIETFWRERERPNIVMLHYSDLKADLEAQMRALASRLGIAIADDRWDDLVHAATFEQMRERATEVGPNTTEPIWLDTTRFFNRGTNGQWRHLLDEDGLRRYDTRVRELVDDGVSAWAHQGPIIG